MKKNNYNAIKNVIYHEIEQEAAKKKRVHTNHNENFDNDIYIKGTEWYNSGLPLDEAPDEYKNNSSFIKGYERGKRLAMIEEMHNNNAKHR